jgi:hypothetical protein
LIFVFATPLIWSLNLSGLPPSIAAYLSPTLGSQFPLFPWAGYILTGAALGQFYTAWGNVDLHRYANRALVNPGAALVALAFAIRSFAGDDAWEAVPTQIALRMGASLLVLGLLAHGSYWVRHLPHVFGAVAQETLLIYFVHLCIVYGSIWNSGLTQDVRPDAQPARNVRMRGGADDSDGRSRRVLEPVEARSASNRALGVYWCRGVAVVSIALGARLRRSRGFAGSARLAERCNV